MHLDNEAARNLFLDRHLLLTPPPAARQACSAADLVARIGFVQVDSINTVERAHHMILWSRAPQYRPADLRAPLETDRSLWEHWTHDASILPIGLYPHWKPRFVRDEARLRANWTRWFREGFEAQFDTILDRIAKDGPVSSSDVGEGEERGKGGWWDWHPSKTALEWLWRTGKIAVTRREGFKKVYDLAENVIPKAQLRAELDPEAHRDWACRTALAQLGFASAAEIKAYWNELGTDDLREWISQAVRRGEVRPLSYAAADGTICRAFALAEDADRAAAAPPRAGRGLRILSPFDPALRDRNRTERLFGFHYRIEVFTPAPKRRYGYYVFPVLSGNRLIGRIDTKANRARDLLEVTAYWPEPGQPLTAARQDALLDQLHSMAGLAGVGQLALADGWHRAPLPPAAWGPAPPPA